MPPKRKGVEDTESKTNFSPKKSPNKNSNKKSKNAEKGEQLYGILEKPNIKLVQYGLDKRFKTWYGSNVYFDEDSRDLGYIEMSGGEVKKNKHNKSHTDGTSSSSIWLNTLYVCEYCFKYTNDKSSLIDHTEVCQFRLNSPPGRIKYKSPKYTIRRVKGQKHELFCQCLCLFTKLFLDNKSMYFKVNNYEFYLLYETNNRKPLGFFSKDLVSYNQNNLACILIFPPYQRKQLGTLLIEFSYKLSKSDGIISGPELPLSPFGLIGYLRYWSQIICYELIEGQLSESDGVTLTDLSKATGLRISDIILTLKHLNCIGENNQVHLIILREWLKNESDKAKRKGINGKSISLIGEEYLLLED